MSFSWLHICIVVGFKEDMLQTVLLKLADQQPPAIKRGERSIRRIKRGERSIRRRTGIDLVHIKSI